MGLFVSSKKEKETWASIVLSGIKPGMQIDDALLEKVADIYINQHVEAGKKKLLQTEKVLQKNRLY